MSLELNPAFDNAALVQLIERSRLAADLIGHHFALGRAVTKLHELCHLKPPDDQPGLLSDGFNFLITYNTDWIDTGDQWKDTLHEFITPCIVLRMARDLVLALALIDYLRQLFTKGVQPPITKALDLAMVCGFGPQADPKSLAAFVSDLQKGEKDEQPRD